MKTFVYCAAILALLRSVLTPLTVAYASPSPADSTHFCQVINPEEWEREQPRPAAKRLQDLNVGEPRTVRLVYFLPNDRTYRPEVVEAMKAGIVELQTFFAEQMDAHGHGRKTFQFEADDQGDPIVHRVDEGTSLRETFDTSKNIFLIAVDNGARTSHGHVVYTLGKKDGQIANIFGGWDWFAAAHELGHAFGLVHDFHDRTYIMSYGRANRSSASLSTCAADFLAVHPYFNSAISLEDGTSPTIELTSPTTYPAGSESVPIRLRLNDSDGLHQVILSVSSSSGFAGGGAEVKSCRGLGAQNDSVIEFDYDGIVPSSSPATSFFSPAVHKFAVIAVDTDGNGHQERFSLKPDIWERQIGTLEGHRQWNTQQWESHSMAISPDGTTLAVAYDDGTVNLWNVSTRTNLTTFRHGVDVLTVAFSPDGTTLASGGHYGKAKLWDIATQTNFATLSSPLITPRGYTDSIDPVVFSPDGTTLAWGSSDKAIRLWDIATKTNFATLEGHTRNIGTLAFSPDGTMLASGSSDRTVKLWDMTTLTNIATFAEERSANSVAFSPDGTTLAVGVTNKTVSLWNLATREKIVRIGWPDPRDSYTNSVAFSPDGSILASIADWSFREMGTETNVNLFAMTTLSKETIATISTPRPIQSVAFSPDGTILATRLQNANIMLWNTSEWAGTPVVNHPPTGAVTISGTADVGETLTVDASAVKDPDGPLTLEFSYQWLADLSPITDATSQTYTLTANEIGKTIRARVSYIDGLGAPVNVASGETEIVSAGICGRTEEAQTAILGQIDGISDCALVTDAHLAAITGAIEVTLGSSVKAGDLAGLTGMTILALALVQPTALPAGMFNDLSNVTFLNLYGEQLTTLPTGAFDGLTSLDTLGLHTRQLTSLPAGVFDPLTNLTVIEFISNLSTLPDGIFDRLTNLTYLSIAALQLSTLPDRYFDQLTSLTTLSLRGTQLTSLPDGIFDRLTALTTLNLGRNQLTNLPAGIFEQLTSLTTLNLDGNQLTNLPAGIFEQLTSLTTLSLDDNQLATLPDGLLSGLSSLTALDLSDNAVDPLPLTVSLEKVGNSEFKAMAPTGAPFDIVLPVSVANGTINGGATTLTIPKGSVQSQPLGVTRTPGTTSAVTVNIGDLPELPTNTGRYGIRLHKGYALVKSADLPLAYYVGAEGRPGNTPGGQAATDFNGDGKTDFVDFFLFADAYGGTDPQFDLDGSGTVDFVDFFKFIDAFGS